MKTLIVCNWKMNPGTVRDALTLARGIEKEAKKYSSFTVAVAPTFLHLSFVKSVLKKVSLAVQDVSAYREGAHTGEVSAKMLTDAKVTFVIVGHSERRRDGETNGQVNAKLRELYTTKVSPILCVGEKSRDESVWYMHEIKTQLTQCLTGITKKQITTLIIAYEPVWAIGATASRGATPQECEEMVLYIRKILADIYDAKTANTVSILYGGSISEKNADLFLSQGRVDGLLVGRTSLSIASMKQLFTRVDMIKR